MPPLMGWVTATGRVDPGGLALFAILFVWQVPHFAAIAAYRGDEYAQAGLKVLSFTDSPRLARATVVLSSLALLLVSLTLLPLDLAGPVYAAAAVLLGLGFLARALKVLRLGPDPRALRSWAKSVFLYSLIYLTALFAALGLDRTLRL